MPPTEAEIEALVRAYKARIVKSETAPDLTKEYKALLEDAYRYLALNPSIQGEPGHAKGQWNKRMISELGPHATEAGRKFLREG